MRNLLRPVVPALVTLASLTACGGGGGGEPTALPISVSVSPTSSTVDAGGTVTLSATVTNATNNAVTWSATGGAVQGSGASATWSAPGTGGTYTVTATSVEDATKKASATVTVNTASVSITPATTTLASGATGNFTATVTGAVVTGVTWAVTGGTLGTPSGGSVDWVAPATGGTFTITATSTADPSRSASATITVTPVTVAVDPPQATIGAGGSQSITATVTGGVDASVTWSANGGTITGNGATVTWQGPVAGGSFTITATSVLDPTRTGTANVTVTPVVIAVSPTTSNLFRGEPTSFTATVTGAAAGNDGVTWESTCGTATPDDAQLNYTAPGAAGSCTVTATSTLDQTKSASATVTVRTELLVSALDDVNDGTCAYAHCSLREAITAANAAPNPDVIFLGPPVAPLGPRVAAAAEPLTGVILLTSDLPTITSALELRGPGRTNLAIDANAGVGMRRVLLISGAVPVSISGLTLRNGRANTGGGLLVQGGADVTLNGVGITGSTALAGPGGGVLLSGGSLLDAIEVLVEGNAALGATGDGGGIGVNGGSVLIVRNSMVRQNTSPSFGGGIYGTESTIQLESSTVELNTGRGGGGLSAWNKVMLTVNGGLFTGNRGTEAGGAMLIGAGFTTPATRTTAELNDVVVEDNTAAGQGAGVQVIRNAQFTMRRSIVRRNVVDGPQSAFPAVAGGVLVGDFVAGLIEQSTIADNQVIPATAFADDGGGGLMFSGVSPNASLVVRNTTLSGNVTPRSGGGFWAFTGTQGLIENSTISGNTAQSGGATMTRGALTLRNVTVAGNSATLASGGIGTVNAGSTALSSVLLAGNLVNAAPGNCGAGGGPITSTTSNLSDDGTCPLVQASDLPNTAAGLGPLADNGGMTMTHALLAGSAAIDQGDGASCPAMDQRGAARAGACDIGAFEFGATAPFTAGRVIPVSKAALRSRLGPPAAAQVRARAPGEGPVQASPPSSR